MYASCFCIVVGDDNLNNIVTKTKRGIPLNKAATQTNLRKYRVVDSLASWFGCTVELTAAFFEGIFLLQGLLTAIKSVGNGALLRGHYK